MTLPTDMQLRICATVAWSCSPNTLSGLFWNWGACGFSAAIVFAASAASRAKCSLRTASRNVHQTGIEAGLAAQFCRRGRGRLREPFPAHALGMDRIGPCLALGYCRLLTQPCEHGDSVMSLWEMACFSSLSPLASFLAVEARSTAGSSHVPHSLDCA